MNPQLSIEDHRDHVTDDVLKAFQLAQVSVSPDRLFGDVIATDEDWLRISGENLSRSSKVAVFGFGKVSAYMARTVYRILNSAGVTIVGGRVNCPQGSDVEAGPIEIAQVRPAGQNIASAEAVESTRQMLSEIAALDDDVVVIVLVSGGGSKLLVNPAGSLTVEHIRSLDLYLDGHQASIEQRNSLQTYCDDVKGGGLAHALGSRQVFTFILNDIIGNDEIGYEPEGLKHICASGPTVSTQYKRSEGHQYLAGLVEKDRAADKEVPELVLEVLAHLESGEEQKPPVAENVRSQILASNSDAVAKAAEFLNIAGFTVVNLGSKMIGDPVERGRELAEKMILLRQLSHERQIAFVCGGETATNIPSDSVGNFGGRAQAMILAAVVKWQELGFTPSNLALACLGTDGEDGKCPVGEPAVAGALVNGHNFRELARQRVSPEDCLRHLVNCDLYQFMKGSGLSVITGLVPANNADVVIGAIDLSV